MAAYRWSGSIQVGPMLQFPVTAKSAIKMQKIAFNLHHSVCGAGLARGADLCNGCGVEVPKDEIVRGYNGKAGIDSEYLKSLEFEKSEILDIEGFVDASEIDPRWYQQSYNVSPAKGGEKAYAMLVASLKRTNKVAIGKAVMGGNENVVTLRERDGVLAMELMYWPAEVLEGDEAQFAMSRTEVSDKEIDLGTMLVQARSIKFDPSRYTNQLYERKIEYIEAFMADQAPTFVPSPTKASSPVADLEAALAASLAAVKTDASEKVAAKKAGKKVAA